MHPEHGIAPFKDLSVSPVLHLLCCLWAAVLFPGAATALFASDTADSLAYELAREQMLANEFLPDEYDGYLSAAEELAAEGLFAEAYTVLADVVEEESPSEEPAFDTDSETSREIALLLDEIDSDELPTEKAGPAIAPGHSSASRIASVGWRITTGASYEQFADGLTAEDSASDPLFDSLAETGPLNARIRAAGRFEHLNRFVQELEPSFYLSDTRSQAGLAMEGDLTKGVLSYAMDLAGEKKLGEAYGDSSDALKGDLELTGSTSRLNDRFWLELPVRLAAERYRHDRSTYTRFEELHLHPAVHAAPGEGASILQLQWRQEWIRFGELGSDDSRTTTGPRLILDLWTTHLSGSFTAEATRTRYPNAETISRRDEILSIFDLHTTSTSWIELSLSATLSGEKEWYPDQTFSYQVRTPIATRQWDSLTQAFVPTVDTLLSYHDTVVSYELRGTRIQLRPAVRFAPGRRWYFQPELGIERFRYPPPEPVSDLALDLPLSPWESSDAWEPLLRIGFVDERLSFELSGGYRRENLIDETFSPDNSEIITGGDISWQLVPWVRIDCMASVRYRMLDDGTRETDTYLSLNSSMAF